MPVTDDRDDPRLHNIEPSGMQEAYLVLSQAERDKGFVRPLRHSYTHQRCGTTTSMGDALAQTYARDPSFYTGTYCASCHAHYPVGADGQFVWAGTSTKVGT